MLFFIDETWQSTEDRRYKAGALAALPLDSTLYNKVSQEVYDIKRRHLGFEGATLELKGQRLFQRFYFRLERKGIRSDQLNMARDIFSYCESLGVKLFASVTFDEEELDLSCANANQLERPFFYLFERINQFMKEDHPGKIAKLIFDDRGAAMNQRISSSVSNFFHKSAKGRSFDRILKVPFFAISRENVGIQLADLMGHVIGRRFTGDRETIEFFQRAKALRFESKEEVEMPDGPPRKIRGIKVAKERPEGKTEQDEPEA